MPIFSHFSASRFRLFFDIDCFRFMFFAYGGHADGMPLRYAADFAIIAY